MKLSHITIGTRGSHLSLAQTNIIKNKLQELLPDATIEVKTITTQGDRDMAPIPLDTIGKGWFTKEIDKQLLDGDIDLAVHSLKDISDTLPKGLIIASIPEREDAREALISKDNKTLTNLPAGASIGTDSTRRKAQLLHIRPDLTITSLRGNVNRRLEKLDAGQYDAICLAVAGLKRLGLDSRIAEYFDETEIVPSPGQGALAIVIKEENRMLHALLQGMNDHSAQSTVEAERAFSQEMGGGCKMPVGAYAKISKHTITLYGMIGSTDGSYLEKDSITGDNTKPSEIGRELAMKLLDKSKTWYTKPS